MLGLMLYPEIQLFLHGIYLRRHIAYLRSSGPPDPQFVSQMLWQSPLSLPHRAADVNQSQIPACNEKGMQSSISRSMFRGVRVCAVVFSGRAFLETSLINASRY